MGFGFPDQRYHFADECHNIFHLGTDVGSHLCGRGRPILQHMVIIRQFIHTQHDHIGTVLVLRSQFSDNGNAVQNGIAGCLDLFYGGHHSVKVGFDTVGHGTVGLVQMADGHDIADVTQDDTGQLQLVILHIGSTVKAQHVAVDGSAHNDQRVNDTAVDHEFPVLIQDQ